MGVFGYNSIPLNLGTRYSMLLSNGEGCRGKIQFRGQNIRPGFTHFVPILTAEVVGVLHSFSSPPTLLCTQGSTTHHMPP